VRVIELPLAGSFELTFEPSADARGSFMRWYDREIFARHRLPIEWVQGNESSSKQNVVRGLHFQHPPYAESKLVRASVGIVYDVFVDLRRDSPSYGRWHAVELSAAKRNAVLIPKRFAHGFCVLSTEATVTYLVDCPYSPAAEGGLIWNDQDLSIPWPLKGEPVVSEKDRLLPRLRDLKPLG
jgi:dTDP-4-dehydrorhamnose 3,5-epimerase